MGAARKTACPARMLAIAPLDVCVRTPPGETPDVIKERRKVSARTAAALSIAGAPDEEYTRPPASARNSSHVRVRLDAGDPAHTNP
jgi:hypothetical protein